MNEKFEQTKQKIITKLNNVFEKTKEFISNLNRKKTTALMTVLMIITQMFSPYTALLNTVYAEIDPNNDKLVKVSASEVEQLSSGKVIKVTYYVTGENINGIDFNIGYDSTKIKPAQRGTGAECTLSTLSTATRSCLVYGDLVNEIGFDVDDKTLNSDDCSIQIAISEPSGSFIVPEEEGYSAEEPMSMFTLYFRLEDETITQLTKDMLYFKFASNGNPTGYKYMYFKGEKSRLTTIDLNTVEYEGFKEEDKTVTSIDITQDPSNLNYEHGQSVSLDGGQITVQYSDGSSAIVEMTDSRVSIVSGNPANVNDPNVTVSFGGQTDSFSINVTDPVETFRMVKSMTRVEYNHSDSIEFAGIEFEAVTKSGVIKNFTESNIGAEHEISVSETTASVNSKHFTKLDNETGTGVEVKGTQILTFTYEGKEVTQTIIVNDKISSIEVTNQPTKTNYRMGEELDLRGTVIRVTLASGNTTDIQLPDGSVTVSTYDKDKIDGPQELTVTLGDHSASEKIKVEAYDYVVSSSLSEPDKLIYKYGENLELETGKLILRWKSNNRIQYVDLSDTKITGYNNHIIDEQTVKVEYTVDYKLSDTTIVEQEKIEKTFMVEVINPAKSIDIVAPDKKDYNHGQDLVLTGGSITVTYEDNSTNTVQMTKEMITEVTGEPAKMNPDSTEYHNYELSKKLKIKYTEDEITGEADYDITIHNNITGIEIKSDPSNTKYNINDREYNLEGGKINVLRAAGDKEEIDLDEENPDIKLTPLESLTTSKGMKEVTVTYKNEYTTNFNITVENGIKDITITKPKKTEYVYGDKLDLEGGKVTITYADGTHVDQNLDSSMVKETATNSDVIMNPSAEEFRDGNTITKNLTIKYTADDGTEKTETYNITIENVIDCIEMGVEPTTEYSVKDSEWQGMESATIIVKRKAGNSNYVKLETSMLPNLSTLTTEANPEKEVQVTYTDPEHPEKKYNTTFNINVVDTVRSITIEKDSTLQTKYNHGESLNYNGIKIYVKYASTEDSSKGTEVTVTEEMIKDVTDIESGEWSEGAIPTTQLAAEKYNIGNTSTRKLKVSYTVGEVTQTEEFEITVYNIAESIKIDDSNKPKQKYSVNDETENPGGNVIITRKAGNTETKAINELTVEDLSTKSAGSFQAKVKYTEKDAHEADINLEVQYDYEVEDTVKGITIETDSNLVTKYNHGESLNYKGIKIYVKYASTDPDSKGTEVAVTPEMIRDVTEVVSKEWSEGTVPTTELEAEKYGVGNTATRTLKVSHTVDGTTETKEFEITVYNIAESIKIDETDKPKDKYSVKESTDNPIGKVVITRKAGNTEKKAISELTIEGLSTESAGSYKATVKYTEKDAHNADINLQVQYDYEVEDTLNGVEIGGEPTNTEYDWGEALDLSGLTFTNQYSSNDQVIDDWNDIKDKLTITIGDQELTDDYLLKPNQSEFESENPITKRVKVKYQLEDKTYEKEFDIKIKDNVDSINVLTAPDKLTYNVKEDTWDLSAVGASLGNNKAELLVTYQSGRTEKKELTKEMLPELSGLTEEEGNDKEVKVTYPETDKDGGEVSTTFQINVVDGIVGVTIDTAEFTKDKYNYNETPDFSQIKIEVEHASGKKDQIAISSAEIKDVTNGGNEDVKTNLSVDAFDGGSHIATRDIKITYTADEDHSDTKNVKIYVYDIVDHIDINPNSEPKKSYSVKEDTSTPGGQIRVYRKADPDSFELVDITKDMVTGLTTATPAVGLKATVKYESKDAHDSDNSKTIDYNYDVIDTLNGVTITGTPKTEYNWGDELDLSDLIFTNQFASQDQVVESIDSIKPYLKVEEEHKAIEINEKLQPDKSEYEAIDSDSVTKHIKVTYTFNEKTAETEFDIHIKDNMESIAMKNQPDDTTYNIGDKDWKLDAVAGKDSKADIEITYQSGRKETVNIEADMLSPELSELTANEGLKPVTVTHGTNKENTPLTTQFNITVENGITNVVIKGDMTNTKYNWGENVDYAGLSIEITKADGTTETRSIEDATKKDITDVPEEKDVTTSLAEEVFRDASDYTVTRTIKVSYEIEGHRAIDREFTITVKNIIDHIDITEDPVKQYQLHDSTEEPGGKITIYRKANTISSSETKDITKNMVDGLNTDTVGTRTATVKYTEQDARGNNINLSDTYEYKVIDTVDSIELEPEPSKKEYKYGEDLDLDDLHLKVHKSNGTIEEVEVTEDMIKGFNSRPNPSDLPNTQEVTITYGQDEDGNDVTTTFSVTVKDYILRIEVKNAKTEYKYEQGLDLSVGTLEIIMASGAPTQSVPLDDPKVNVQGYVSTTIGPQTLDVTYNSDEFEDATTQYTVNVVDYIKTTTIEVPTKTRYNYGDRLELGTGNIKYTWASGKTTNEAITEDMVTEEDGETPVNMTPTFNSSNKTQKKLKITKDDVTVDYDIEIINDVKSVVMKDEPRKDYNYGDDFDNTQGSVEVSYANGKTETVPLSDSRITVSGFDSEGGEADNQLLTVEFEENGVKKETSYTVNIHDNVTDIELVGDPIKEYLYGDSLNLDGLQLKVTRPSGETTIPVTSNMVSGYDPNKLGKQTVTVTYSGHKETFEVNVSDWLKDIELIKPEKINYKLDEDLDLTGAYIVELYASGAKGDTVKVTDNMVTGFDSSTEGPKTLTVTYTKDDKEFEKTFVIIVIDGLSDVRVKNFPADKYLWGQDLDLTGATLEVTLESGETIEVPITKDMVSGYVTRPSSSHFEESDEYVQIIEIKYTKDGITKTAKYPVTTKDYIASIKVEGMQTEYIWGEDLNLDNATVAKVSASGVVSDKTKLTKDMVSGYDARKEGKQTLTISYADMTTTKVVTVVDNILGISMNQLPNKTTYKYGANIDLTGAKLNVIKNSGTYVIDITKDMISGYNARKAGTQEILVTYAGYTTEFAVTVQPRTVVTKPNTDNNGNSTDTPNVDEPEELPVVQPNQEQQNTDNKQEAVLGVQDEQSKGIDFIKLFTYLLADLLIIFLIILIIRRNNVEIYVDEDEENCRLVGTDRLSRDDNQEIDLAEYIEEYPDKDIEVVFAKRLAKKLDGKTVIFKLTEDKQHKVVIKYEDNEYIIKFEKEVAVK